MTHDASNWTSTVDFSTHSVKNSFPLGNKNFNQAILAIELTGVSWDFGELVWENVTMVSIFIIDSLNLVYLGGGVKRRTRKLEQSRI